MLPSNTKLKTKQPCQTPGCDYPNFHVCLVGKPDTFPQLLGDIQRKNGGRVPLGERTQEHKDSIAAGQVLRWARVHEANRERDETIVSTYREGLHSIRTIGEMFGVSKDKVMRLLRKAEIEVREPGRNIRHGAE